ncbi:MAG: translation initiation factor IF-2 [Patescibacteria group bacterium]|nr:translation initiation factor IF-2 [Patescibacteria group bacterium]
MTPNENAHTVVPRPPVVVVMGHVDHGKSTLLDFIRKTNVVAGESGGITQHIAAYEVTHTTRDGEEKRLTFIDTPGHEAFAAMRSRGARVADIAILVVSAEEGVKAQTLEAYGAIRDAGIVYVVAINKIDRPAANVERTKQNLAESGIYLEGYGGDVPSVPISAKTGEGVAELLDVVVVAAELAELTGSPDESARGVVIESHVDQRRGISATLIITNGTLTRGMFLLASESIAPTRILENFLGEPTQSATFSSPVRITGFASLPDVGAPFVSFRTRQEAEHALAAAETRDASRRDGVPTDAERALIPIVIKADALGTAEAVAEEARKVASGHERIGVKILHAGVGAVGENDIMLAGGDQRAVILGFRVPVENTARERARRDGVAIETFDIIYKLSEWLATALVERTPKITSEERTGAARILKIFNRTRDRQVVGGEVVEGVLIQNARIKILRRGAEISRGKILGLQKQKAPAEQVDQGNQCGIEVESKIEIVPGDVLEAFHVVTK